MSERTETSRYVFADQLIASKFAVEALQVCLGYSSGGKRLCECEHTANVVIVTAFAGAIGLVHLLAARMGGTIKPFKTETEVRRDRIKK